MTPRRQGGRPRGGFAEHSRQGGRPPSGQRGQAIVLIALMMAVLVGFVALAIDSARAFDSRRIMQDSVDSAALAAAEYYQNNPGSWTTAESRATFYFQLDNRVLGGTSCSPGSVSPTPGAPGTPLSMTCTFGSSNYQLKITAEDDGPGGQTFTVLGQNTLDLALMQVLGQTSTVTVKATGAATASDQARTPALTALSSAGCPWAVSGNPLSVSTSSTLLSVLGDVVSGGTFNVSTSSNVSVAGDVDTRCGLVGFPTHVTTRCWPSGAATPCTAPDVAGTKRSAAFHPVDPGYSPPPSQSSPASPPVANQVILPPGLYSANPFTTTNGCYFLAGGIFEFSNTFSVTSGLVSNELRPPAAPVYGSTTSISPDQFWDDNDHSGSPPHDLHCDGDFAITAVPPVGGQTPLPLSSYSVVLTSVRSDTVNGTSYLRESVPSACKSVTVPPGDVVQLTISNVPGATSYNVYAVANGTCTGTFDLVSGPSTSVTGTPLNNNLAGCPDTTTTPNCSLGQVNAIYDGSATLNALSHPPDAIYKPFAANYPGQSPLRATPRSGDLANENYCGSGGAAAACPTSTNAGASQSLVTPGAVEISLTGNSCLSVIGGDTYLFSGYQYDWIVNYEPIGSTCTSTWQGRYDSALLGLSYTPGASFHFAGNFGSQTSCFGGVMASTVLVQTATTLALDYAGICAPSPWGTRLTG